MKKRKKRLGCSLHTRVQNVQADPREKGQGRRPRFHKVSGSTVYLYCISRKRIESVVFGPRRLHANISHMKNLKYWFSFMKLFRLVHSSKKRLQSITAKNFCCFLLLVYLSSFFLFSCKGLIARFVPPRPQSNTPPPPPATEGAEFELHPIAQEGFAK